MAVRDGSNSRRALALLAALAACGPPLTQYDARIDTECDTLERCRALHDEIRREHERCSATEVCQYTKYLNERVMTRVLALKREREEQQ